MKKIHRKNFKLFLGLVGSPLRTIELSEENYKTAHKQANDIWKLYYKPNKRETSDIFESTWIRQYTFTELKNILGLIRGKFDGQIGISDNVLNMNYQSLLAQSEKEKEELLNLIK